MSTTSSRIPGRVLRRAIAGTLLIGAFLTMAVTSELRANGGTLRLANVPMGEYLVSAFTDPTPVRPDSLDVSVLVLQSGVEGIAEDVDVWVLSRPLGHAGEERRVAATREQADDPRYYAAKFPLGHEGQWHVEVEVSGPAGHGIASFEVRARDPGILGHPLTLALLALLPLAGAAWWVFRQPEPETEPAA